ncbi:MAG: ATP-binding cassette domain-containing protein, partial [Bacteroidia bacterium]|nr:ATP-binding cassette domain-containing protein [Bacteroidia bacterium]
LIGQSIFSYFRGYLFVNHTENILANLRQALYNNLIKLPMSFFTQSRVGELNSRLSADISQIQDTLTTTLAEFLRQFILIIGGLILLSVKSLSLTLLMLSIVPVVAVAAVVFGRFIRRFGREVQDKVAQSNTIVEETLQAIASVKAFANEAYEVARYKKSIQEVVKTAIEGGKYRGYFSSFVIFCLFGAIVAVIWYGVKLSIGGQLTIGELISFVLYSVFVGASFGGIAELYAQLQKAIGSMERVFDLLDEKGENITLESNNYQNEKRLKGSINFSGISFAYPGRKEVSVLNEVSFVVEEGQKVAIVGQSGAGKSTIAQLVMRFYDVTGGAIYINNKEIGLYDLTDLRSNMAIVPQDVILFGGTIRENIAYGKPNATIEEIIEAAKKANAHNFIEEFPHKYDTVVGERGVQLSGGQRQRIAIARAVLRNPSILILDEATSSLDSESERLVQDALDLLMVGRTSIIIAHRLSTIKNADKIIVLEKGKIAETGTHEQLLNKADGVYRQLNVNQFS